MIRKSANPTAARGRNDLSRRIPHLHGGGFTLASRWFWRQRFYIVKDMSKLPGRAELYGEYGDARNGFAFVKMGGRAFKLMFSDGEGWDHVSVSTAGRCPLWEEMCKVKDLFFEPEDVVVQYHPRASEYRNCHPYCLHLWRCQTVEFPTPDPYMIAPA